MLDKITRDGKKVSISMKNKNSPFFSAQTALKNALDDFSSFFKLPALSFENYENFSITPLVDIVDDEKSFKIEAEVPGMGPEDLKVSINNDMLTIKGEKTVSSKDKGKNYQSREIAYGSYQRSMSLPDSLDIDKAKATFKKGMLWIDIPKKEGTTKHIREIKVEQAGI